MRMCKPASTSENNKCRSSIHESPEALGKSRCESPPSAGTSQVSHDVPLVNAMRAPSGENVTSILLESRWVICCGAPLGKSITYTCSSLMKPSRWPSGENSASLTVLVELVSCVHCEASANL